MPHKKFNAFDRGQEFQSEKNKDDDRKLAQCWTYGKYHRQRDYPQHQGGIPQIYSDKEEHMVGYVG